MSYSVTTFAFSIIGSSLSLRFSGSNFYLHVRRALKFIRTIYFAKHTVKNHIEALRNESNTWKRRIVDNGDGKITVYINFKNAHERRKRPFAGKKIFFYYTISTTYVSKPFERILTKIKLIPTNEIYIMHIFSWLCKTIDNNFILRPYAFLPFVMRMCTMLFLATLIIRHYQR